MWSAFGIFQFIFPFFNFKALGVGFNLKASDNKQKESTHHTVWKQKRE